MASGCNDCKRRLASGMCDLHPYGRPTEPGDFCENWYPVKAEWYPEPEKERA